MIAGRRGNARDCLSGGLCLLCLAQGLAAGGPIWFAGSYWQQMLAFNTSIRQMLAPLLMPAALGWSLSLLVWLAGWLGCFLAAGSVRAALSNLAAENYRLSQIRLPLILSLCSAGLFFATFILIHWPFAGLPENIGWDRVIMAIWRNATSNYFLALSNAGILALLALIWLKTRLSRAFAPIATRWLAFWGLAGVLPHALTRWGYALNASRAGGIAAQGVKFQVSSLALLTAAGLCCAVLLWRPRLLMPLAWASFALLLARAFLPLVLGPHGA